MVNSSGVFTEFFSDFTALNTRFLSLYHQPRRLALSHDELHYNIIQGILLGKVLKVISMEILGETELPFRHFKLWLQTMTLFSGIGWIFVFKNGINLFAKLKSNNFCMFTRFTRYSQGILTVFFMQQICGINMLKLNFPENSIQNLFVVFQFFNFSKIFVISDSYWRQVNRS